MKRLLLLTIILLTACGPSPEEKKNIAAVTCSIMSETGNMDGAVRVREMNDAREKLGGEPFLDGDEAIQESFEFGLCQELVLDDSYKEILQPLKDAKRERERLAEEKRAEEARIAEKKRRIAANKLAEEKRIAAEKQRIADSKPTVKEEFYPSGKLKSRTNFKPKSEGGRRHGLEEKFWETGELSYKSFYDNGLLQGLKEGYMESGHLVVATNYVDDEREGVEKYFYRNGNVETIINWKDGKREGPYLSYYRNGNLEEKKYFKNGREDGLWETFYENGNRRLYRCYRFGRSADKSYCEK